MKVLILAAGYGTRLKEISKDKPKALIEVAGKSLIDHILNRFEGIAGINEVLVVTNDKFCSDFEEWANSKEDRSYSVKIINDGTRTNEERLGSIGDINFVLKNVNVDDDLVVVGGDNLFDFDIKSYIEFAKGNGDAVSIGVYDIGNIEEATKFGVVAVDEKGKVTSFEEKPEKPKSSLIAMCFYYMPKNSLVLLDDYLKETGKFDKAGDYISWVQKNKSVYAYKFEGKWFDIGSIESYNEAQENFK